MNSLNNKVSRLIPLFLLIFIDSLGYFLVIPVLLRLFIHGDYGLISPSTSLSTRNMLYGITVTLSPLAFLLSAPIIGNFSDKYGRKKTLFWCLIGSLVGFILPIIGILNSSLTLLLLGRFIAGAASSSQPVAQAAIADFTVGKQKAFYLAMIGFAMTLAMVLGPLGGGYLSDSSLVKWFNVMTPYWAGVILSLLNIVLLLAFYHEEPSEQKKAAPAPISKSAAVLFNILGKPKVGLLLVVFILMELAWSQYYQVIFLYLSEFLHFKPSEVGLFTGYIGFWMSLGLTLIYRIAIRYISIEKITRSSIAMIAIGFVAVTFIPGSAAQWVFIILIALFVGMAYPSLLALISNSASKEHQGWIMGIASTLLGLAWMLTAFLSGWLINYYHRLPFLFGTFCILAALAVLLLSKRNKA